MSHASKGHLGLGASRKNALTKMVLATARTTREQTAIDQLSLAQLRENLITMDAIEAFETAEPRGRFSRWIGRGRQKSVMHVSERPEANSLFPAGPLFNPSRK